MIKQYGASQNLRNITHDEEMVGVHVYTQNISLKPNESLLIVTDEKMRDTEAAIFFESAKKFTDYLLMIEIPLGQENAEEPPPEAAYLMESSDVVLMVTTYSLSHTRARFNACKNGARIISMPTITREIMLRTLPIDYAPIAHLSKKIAALQTQAEKAHIKSSNGTDLTFSLKGRNAIADTGLFINSGDFGNLPAGEAFIAPVEGTANGTICFDGCFADIELDEPIHVTVKHGQAIKIDGGQSARLLNERLARVGKNGYNIAEFGIGTNKKTKLGNNLLEVEKVYGTCHIALGNNATFGGEVDVPFHSDGVILSPTIMLDDKKIIVNGKFIL